MFTTERVPDCTIFEWSLFEPIDTPVRCLKRVTMTLDYTSEFGYEYMQHEEPPPYDSKSSSGQIHLNPDGYK